MIKIHNEKTLLQSTSKHDHDPSPSTILDRTTEILDEAGSAMTAKMGR